jgi:hypothetical protein
MVRAGGRWRVLLATAGLALVASAAPAGAQDGGDASTSTTAAPTTTTIAPLSEAIAGPVAADAGTKGGPVTAAVEPLSTLGYVEQEVFLSGTATIHGQRGVWGRDGRWSTTDLGEVPYRTRLLVRRPADDADFSGTVFVSWLNVSGGFDADPEWSQVADEVVREGAAWVGVTAQSLGVSGVLGARAWDPQRYGSLDLSGDGASYDVFTQAAEAVRSPKAVDPLGGLTGDRRLIAVGQSQSAQRLVTYANAFQPTSNAFDGFLLVSRFRGAAPLGRVLLPPSQAVDPDGSQGLPYLPDPVAALLSGPPAAKVRDDLDVPVFTVITETEAVQDRNVARPDDDDHFRTWEVAGASHADATTTAGLLAALRRDFPQVPVGQLECPTPNSFPLRYALRAATQALASWVDKGTAPPIAPPLERDSSGGLVRDAEGNAKGGLRLPEISVPTARHSGESTGTGYCGLTGATVPFTPAQLAKRYPTSEAYVTALTAAIHNAVEAGFLLSDDATELLDVTVVPGSNATVAAIVQSTSGAGAVDRETASEPAKRPSSASGVEATAKAAEPATTEHGWMATTGRDLITPFLAGLLLLLNGRVVLTISRQRRRGAS